VTFAVLAFNEKFVGHFEFLVFAFEAVVAFEELLVFFFEGCHLLVEIEEGSLEDDVLLVL
jgi:hypothetical protein